MRRRRIAAVAALMALAATACNNSTPTSKVVTNANPVRAAADLSCSLPVRAGDQFGFVDFPSGRFRADSSAPYPNHNPGFVYAHGARKWVPVSYAFAAYQLSPDETQMAALEQVNGSQRFATGVSAVDLRTNKSQHVATLPGPAYRVLGWQSDGIYVIGGALYRVDPMNGKVTTINVKNPEALTSGLFFWVTSAAAWSSLIAGPNQGDKDSVQSISVSDGSVTTWYTAPAQRSVSILGFVAPDQPLVAEYNTEPYDRMTGVSFMLLTSPGTAEALNFDPSINAWGVTDSFGVWLESPGHLWLYDTAGLFAMATLSAESVGIGAGLCR